MMKLKSLSIILAGAMALSTATANAGGLTSVGTVTTINSGTNLLVKGTMTGNPDGCTDTDAFVLNSDGNPNYKNIYAALLTAYAADKEIRLFVDGCVDNAAMTKNRPSIGSLVLQ